MKYSSEVNLIELVLETFVIFKYLVLRLYYVILWISKLFEKIIKNPNIGKLTKKFPKNLILLKIRESNINYFREIIVIN